MQLGWQDRSCRFAPPGSGEPNMMRSVERVDVVVPRTRLELVTLEGVCSLLLVQTDRSFFQITFECKTKSACSKVTSRTICSRFPTVILTTIASTAVNVARRPGSDSRRVTTP